MRQMMHADASSLADEGELEELRASALALIGTGDCAPADAGLT